MKTKTYHYGKYTCRTYCKPVGNGWETGFTIGTKPIFVGNFIYPTEATRWYAIMNHEITKFGKKYTTGYEFPISWFSHFIKNHLYSFYYAYLDKLFMRYNRKYTQALHHDVRQFKRTKSHYHCTHKRPCLKAA